MSISIANLLNRPHVSPRSRREREDAVLRVASLHELDDLRVRVVTRGAVGLVKYDADDPSWVAITTNHVILKSLRGAEYNSAG